MRRSAAVVLLVPVLVLAPHAAAKDDEPLAEPHPLRASITERFRLQQVQAAERVVDTVRALHHAAAAGYVDTDHDGRGEYPALAEMLGLAPWRGSDDPPAGIIGWSDAVLREGGVVEASGYLYRVELPDSRLEPAATLADVDADLAEEDAVVLAWPVRYGLSGRWTFGFHVQGKAPLAADVPGWSGRASPPPPEALLVAPDAAGDVGPGGLADALRTAGEDRLGNRWVPARGMIERLRTDEPDLDVPESIEPEWGRLGRHWVQGECGDLWKAVLRCDTTPRPEGFVASPPVVRVATPQEIGAAIAADLRFPMERTGQWERQKASFALVGAATPAKYVESERVVLLCPETLAIVCRVADVPDELLADALRLLVAHEMAHALDFQTFPLTAALHDCEDEASIAAWSAVVEGHAQQMTRRVAADTQREPAFAALLRLTTADDDDAAASPSEARAVMLGLSFPYADGERFMDAVRERWKEEGVAETLRHPPTRPMLVETPELWFARGRGAAPVDWTAITEPLARIEPPGADVRRTPVLRRTLREALAVAPQLDADAITAGIVDVESRIAVAPDGRTQSASSVLLCRDASAARAYVIASRVLQTAQDRAYAQNPLVEPEVRYAPPPDLAGVTAGYRVQKELRSGGSTVHAVAISVARGRWVVEVAETRLGDAGEATERSLVRAVDETLRALPAE